MVHLQLFPSPMGYPGTALDKHHPTGDPAHAGRVPRSAARLKRGRDTDSSVAIEEDRRYQVCAAARTSTSLTATRRSRVTM
jgi:hypothetical protein